MNNLTNKPIKGVPIEYTNGMELVIREQDGEYYTFEDKPAMVMGRVHAVMQNGRIEYVPDADGNIVEYLVDGKVRYDHIEDLSEMVVGFIPAYQLNDTLSLQTKDRTVHGTVIAEENSDGLITVQTDLPIDERVVNQFTREQLDAMIQFSHATFKEQKAKNIEKQPSDKTKSNSKYSIKDIIFTWLGCGFWIVLIVIIVGNCTHSYISNKNKERHKQYIQDSLTKRKKFIKDSIEAYHNTPEYKAHLDSLHLALESERIENEKNTTVIIYLEDSCFHYTTLCTKNASVLNAHFTSEYDARQKGLKECDKCYERNMVFLDYEDDALVYTDDLTDKYSKQDIIEMFDIKIEDLY